MKRDRRVFMAGAVFVLAIHSLIQDIMGKSSWLRWEASDWWPAAITVPAAVVGLLWALYALGDSMESSRKDPSR